MNSIKSVAAAATIVARRGCTQEQLIASIHAFRTAGHALPTRSASKIKIRKRAKAKPVVAETPAMVSFAETLADVPVFENTEVTSFGTSLSAALAASVPEIDAIIAAGAKVIEAVDAMADRSGSMVGHGLEAAIEEIKFIADEFEIQKAAERATFREDGILCLLDGKVVKDLGRHARKHFGINAVQYRERFGFSVTYPMTLEGVAKFLGE